MFARVYEKVAAMGERRGGAEHRRGLLAGLSGRVVEIGAGNGASFAHYESTVSGVLAIEPERYLRERAERAARKAPVYVAGYSFARIGEELLRVDPAHHILGLRLNFYVAVILCLVGIASFVRIQRGGVRTPTGRAARRGGALLAAGALLALAGCGQASRTSSAHAQVRTRAAPRLAAELTDRQTLDDFGDF